MNLVLKSDVGRRRKVNQDYTGHAYNQQNYLLVVVCDGMGGHSSGDFASSSAVNQLVDRFQTAMFYSVTEVKEWLHQSLVEINSYLYHYSQDEANFYGMGTTLVAAIFLEDDVVFANVGDSRLYVINDNKIQQLSEDHTFVNSLYRAGYINEEEALNHPRRSVVLFAIGTEKDLQAQIDSFPKNVDYVLLCSDGLYNMVVDSEILEIISDHTFDIEEKVDRLLEIANNNGGIDNIAIILTEVR